MKHFNEKKHFGLVRISKRKHNFWYFYLWEFCFFENFQNSQIPQGRTNRIKKFVVRLTKEQHLNIKADCSLKYRENGELIGINVGGFLSRAEKFSFNNQ